MRIRNWDAVIAADADEKPIAVFDVELDGEAEIKLMHLWLVGKGFEVRCDPQHRVEMSANLSERILEMALTEMERGCEGREG